MSSPLNVALDLQTEKSSSRLTLMLFDCRLVGDVLLATGFLSYSGPFNQSFRTLLLDNWKKEMRKVKIPFSEVMPYETTDIHLFVRLVC